MKDDLRTRLSTAKWTPSILQLYVKQTYMSDSDVEDEFVYSYKQLTHVPNDRSIGALTKDEKKFLKDFERDYKCLTMT